MTFEWILLTLLAIGVMAGLVTVRDTLNVKLADIYEGLTFVVSAA